MRISDWSADVCSSDLAGRGGRGYDGRAGRARGPAPRRHHAPRDGRRRQEAAVLPARRRRVQDRKSVVSGKSVSVRVDLGGRRIIKKTKSTQRVTCSIINPGSTVTATTTTITTP